ncbi:M15 family metallopeptidase [Neptunicella marina]|uniref:M15 family metallopeptidase n=1 Tax=Neptunicella marina TaxID=2125989 RepID=A0A8J6LYW2_9ALTE|nr:M15 family metallopeptidase [Neptunicella marina]MBC3765665.1 M15 family metallopeptidase [Neptunicella marina]
MDVIIDSQLSFSEAIAGSPAPQELIQQLTLLDVDYFSDDNLPHQGQFILHKTVADEVRDIFRLIYDTRFIVHKVIPLVEYQWDDDLAMQHNVSSAFNYRKIAGTDRLSLHALGKAVDINPFWNPVHYEDGNIAPPNARYKPGFKGVFDNQHAVVQAFKQAGWRWGGNWTSPVDHHHFDKPQAAD